MARSARIFYHNQSGRIPKNINLPGFGITNKSAVSITAGHWTVAPGTFHDPGARLVVHGPDVFVTTVVPHGSSAEAEGVEFMLHVDSPSPIDVAVTITVFEEFEVSTVV